ncbi:MAG: cyclase family protein [Bacteroidota bacterium]
MIDISNYLDVNTTPWPGDMPFGIGSTLRIRDGHSVNLSAITTSVHNGTHADAPWHFDDQGSKIDEVNLGAFIGPCIVVDARGERVVTPSMLNGVDIRSGDRVLFQTREPEVSGELDAWNEDNAHLDVNTVIALSNFDCPLVGIDTPSVDPSASPVLTAHHALEKHNIRILENLNLSMVKPGRYLLVALPLKLRGLDASPVRAVLLTREEAKLMAEL